MNKLVRLFNNPTVRRIVVWAAPFVMSWVMKKVSRPSTTTSSQPKKKR